eukprot:m.192213 g.192213  ORF g.192213 m.192213 type:complete len:107 (-) comp14851_c1_seq5:595-915(-)
MTFLCVHVCGLSSVSVRIPLTTCQHHIHRIMAAQGTSDEARELAKWLTEHHRTLRQHVLRAMPASATVTRVAASDAMETWEAHKQDQAALSVRFARGRDGGVWVGR